MTLVDKLRLLFSLCRHQKKSYFDINNLEYKVTYDDKLKRYSIYSPLDNDPICIVNQKSEFGCFLANLLEHKGEL